nr:homeobox protein aristaless-like 4 [Lytechinus pictus]
MQLGTARHDSSPAQTRVTQPGADWRVTQPDPAVTTNRVTGFEARRRIHLCGKPRRVWFQNRRAKWRKRERFSQFNTMRAMATGTPYEMPIAPRPDAYSTMNMTGSSAWNTSQLGNFGAGLQSLNSTTNPMQNWAGQAAATQLTSSCMAPTTTMPSYMGMHSMTPDFGFKAMSNQPHNAGATAHGQSPSAAAAAAAAAGLYSGQTSPSIPTSLPGHSPMMGSGGVEHVETDRRSNSIAALRLKAKEHNFAMGMIGAYS